MALSIFYQFFLLGCTSFGGPAAHLGFFKKHFVDNLGWISNERYAAMISLSQILPGPGSSQVGFAIGLERAGILGGVAAFLGFTLPSFLIMLLLAMTASQLDNSLLGVMNGLKLFAVVIVADAVLSMAKSFCKTGPLKLVAFISTLVLLILPSLHTQLLVLALAALVACVYRFSPIPTHNTSTINGGINFPVLAAFSLLFIITFFGLPNELFAQFYQAGALVFGGGHVVLPLLQNTVSELDQNSFLTAYAAAQAVPGPMFSIATYLGATLASEHIWLFAVIATVAIFLPGLLLMWAFHNNWQSLSSLPRFASVTCALNAAVVGLLAAALYNPIWQSAVYTLTHMIIVIGGFALFKLFKPPIWMMLLLFSTVGVLLY
ncbi:MULTISPECIES: chromate efflux transporter [Pseudoalteromonas]|uniref:Chorismate-binding protein n=1 Tax=Pseudoalteromonas amylolytica TaxID=1859457 RepID=A0A1S1MVR4_9GAMM|nr:MULTISPECIES: chromate efflux transporter [Pseudoalteromonas]MCF6437536.1 chromate efflux transporter [Pseudoalteromonas sp. MMG022]OHU85989.1 chorismate-binding protein [Pseudoalteromonas sp. JW3]OHU89401.1 chorismate-binding protein [Pseudoalteromonas amylolytica]